ncbi:amidohydrolase [Cordyceps fumosorosea ARSEF 2679]|uniref:Amidohydrolase n=1 Tax=Cordyceps fumosorosea (strain ARSEF 2679) TaxID=1081104 RepID=A0A162JT79_CORFA|nr:amidohydrolase [Cordyceps fumosorosea ARSEF 2679]OAA73422.1 amidohydrolase [Cordyceps fumosorosea ARSEF 2679]
MTRRAVTTYGAPANAPAAQEPLAREPPRTESRPSHKQLSSAMRCLGISPASLRSSQRHEYDDDDCTSARAASRKFYTIITSDLLIPGDGEPLPDSAIVVESAIIVWVGPRDRIPPSYREARHRLQHVPYMMPGLWDVHVHFGAASEDPEQAAKTWTYGPLAEHPATQGARLGRECWRALQMGYTSMRDCGGLGCELAAAIDDGAIPGPRVYSAGAYISQTAGHGDQFNMPPGDALLRMGVGSVRPGFFCDQTAVLADGPDECRKAVRLQVRRGARCIKIMATGGVVSLDDDPDAAQFSADEMHALVDEARRMGRAVAAHCHAKAGILASIHAGVTTIEHGSFADEECVALMKERGVIYVPTRRAVTNLLEFKDQLPRKVREKLEMVDARQLAAYRLAVAAGVRIAMGTDTVPGGVRGVEIQHGVEAGLTNLQALKAATATAPLTLGRQGPRSGQLKVGYDADVLGLTENPAEDVKVLQRGEVIKWVWKGGKLFKGPGVGPWGEE